MHEAQAPPPSKITSSLNKTLKTLLCFLLLLFFSQNVKLKRAPSQLLVSPSNCLCLFKSYHLPFWLFFGGVGEGGSLLYLSHAFFLLLLFSFFSGASVLFSVKFIRLSLHRYRLWLVSPPFYLTPPPSLPAYRISIHVSDSFFFLSFFQITYLINSVTYKFSM